MPHMRPLPPNQLEQFAGAFDAMEERMGFVPNSLKTLARKPKLLGMFMEFALETSKDDACSIQLKYLAGLIASTVSGCTYCQAHLSVTAAREAIPDDKIAEIWIFESSDHYDEAERAALRFARDAAQQPNQVTSDHFRDLHQYYSEEQVVELLAIVCLFRWLNCWNDTMATELEEMPLFKAKQLFNESDWSVGKHQD